MITGLRFKNWRSLRDVEITNLTPITVFIGANSSGKSNLLDGLYFLHKTLKNKVSDATIFSWGGYENFHTFGVSKSEPVTIESRHLEKSKVVTCGLQILPPPGEQPIYANAGATWCGLAEERTLRWQLLDENFMPPLFFQMNPRDTYDYHLIERTARNVPLLLNYMQQNHADVFGRLQQDFTFLLDYIDRLETIRDELGIRMVVREKAHQGAESPRISAGTARLIAMLTAMYTLDMRHREQPALLVIEEPDASIHPLLLRRLIDVFRAYTEREIPRQIILTTHNPSLLDYLKPEEIRLVERDDSGFTTVKSVSADAARVWLEDGYTLGEAWLTRSLGGVPE